MSAADELVDDFVGSAACTRAWLDHIWKRREEETQGANMARAAAYESSKAFELLFRDELLLREKLAKRTRPLSFVYSRKPVTAAEVRRLLRAAG